MNKKIICISLISAAVLLFIISFILLPDVVAMQIQFNGQLGNYMPKYIALVIPLIIELIGTLSCYCCCWYYHGCYYLSYEYLKR